MGCARIPKSPDGLNSTSGVYRDQEELPSPGSPSFSFSIVVENLSKMKDMVPPGTRFTGISEESGDEAADAESITDSAPERDD